MNLVDAGRTHRGRLVNARFTIKRMASAPKCQPLAASPPIIECFGRFRWCAPAADRISRQIRDFLDRQDVRAKR